MSVDDADVRFSYVFTFLNHFLVLLFDFVDSLVTVLNDGIRVSFVLQGLVAKFGQVEVVKAFQVSYKKWAEKERKKVGKEEARKS